MLEQHHATLGVYLHLTKDCNLRCRYCYVGEKRAERMTEEVGRLAIDFFLDRTDHLELRYFGGEPLLEVDLLKQLVPYAEARAREKMRSLSQVIVTNGTLLSEEIAEFCAAHKISVSISLDGGARSQDANRLLKNGRGSFEQVAANLGHVLQRLPRTHIVSVVGPDNVDYLPEAVRYLVDRGFRSISLSPEYTHPRFAECLPAFEAALHELIEISIAQRKKGRFIYISTLDLAASPYSRGPCRFGREEFSVAPSGDLYPCTCFVDHDKSRLGNLRTGVDPMLARVFEAEVAALAQHLAEDHRDCPDTSFCKKGCGCTNVVTSGTLCVADHRLCEYGKMETRVRQYFRERLAAPVPATV